LPGTFIALSLFHESLAMLGDRWADALAADTGAGCHGRLD
jgi:hypothetical protein